MLAVLIASLIVLLLIWTLTDPRPIRERLKELTRAYLLITFSLLFQVISSIYFPWPKIPYEHTLFAIGMVLYIAGYVLLIWAKFEMKTNWGPPGQHNIGRQLKLVTTGPFSFSRHPIYFGLILVVLGFSIVAKSILVPLVVILFVHFRNAALAEEILLEKYFGENYKRYKKKIPRFFSLPLFLRHFRS